MRIERVGDGPVISAALSPSIGKNIQGPSLIAVPPWIPNPLGAYYLYFADHKGQHIRLAFADRVQGPWTVHEPGALQLADSCFLTEEPHSTPDEIARLQDLYLAHFGTDYSIDEVMADAVTPHIASPDVHVDHENERIVMYFHGLERLGVQVTRAAVSANGIDFAAQPEILGGPYFRVFRFEGWHYALVMPGQILRSLDGLSNFESGPTLFEPAMRHSAVRVRGNVLDVFWSRVSDAPESILHSTIDLSLDWKAWTSTAERVALCPESAWEGSTIAPEPSRRGAVHGLVNQLRDPCVFRDQDQAYLLYAAGGESAIGLAALIDDK